MNMSNAFLSNSKVNPTKQENCSVTADDQMERLTLSTRKPRVPRQVIKGLTADGSDEIC